MREGTTERHAWKAARHTADVRDGVGSDASSYGMRSAGSSRRSDQSA